MDELDPKEFKDDDSDDNDDRNMFEILDDEGMLGSLEQEKDEKLKHKGCTSFGQDKPVNKPKTFQDKDTSFDKKILGNLFIALKEM